MAVNEPAPASRQALRWQAHKERTRGDLLDAARKLFAERGFHATSAADIAAAAGVTERTLFRYFSTKLALVLDEVAALLPEMFQLIRERPAEEPPYRAVLAGILEFGALHQDLLILIVGAPGGLELSLAEQQRTLIGLEEGLTGALRDRYQLPPEDQITPAVWARASIGALRTALLVTGRHRDAGDPPAASTADIVTACFAALQDQMITAPRRSADQATPTALAAEPAFGRERAHSGRSGTR